MVETNPLRGLTSNISLVGNDDQIKTQMALLLGITQLTEAQLKGFDIDFLKWIDLFEEGFVAGYAAKQHPLFSKKYWGQIQNNRPRIRVIREAKPNWEKQGYYLIELQPDRTIESEAYILFDTPRNLISQIMHWMNLHLKLKNLDVNAEAVGGGNERPLPIYVKGKIYIKLHFKGLIRNTKADHRVEKSFRLMHDDPRTISESRLNALATTLHSKFLNFTFTTGHETYTYNDPEVGFSNIWGHFLDETQAKHLFEQMLDLINTSPDWEKLRVSKVVQPGDRFQDPPEIEVQANIPVRTDRERPIADVRFTKAVIKFPKIRKELDFVNEFGMSLSIVKQIQKYQESQ